MSWADVTRSLIYFQTILQSKCKSAVCVVHITIYIRYHISLYVYNTYINLASKISYVLSRVVLKACLAESFSVPSISGL